MDVGTGTYEWKVLDGDQRSPLFFCEDVGGCEYNLRCMYDEPYDLQNDERGPGSCAPLLNPYTCCVLDTDILIAARSNVYRLVCSTHESVVQIFAHVTHCTSVQETKKSMRGRESPQGR